MTDSTTVAGEAARTITRREMLAGAGAALGAGILAPDRLAAFSAPAVRDVRDRVAPREGDVVFTHTTVVTGDRNRAELRDVAVAISGTTIAAIGPTDEVVRQFQGAEMIDGRTKAILPGVVNCHAHLNASLSRGFNEDFGFPNRYRLPVSPGSLISAEERTLMSVIAALHSIRTGTTTVVEYTSGIASAAEELSKTGLRWVFAEGVNDRVNGSVMSPEVFAASTTPEFSATSREEGLRRVSDLYAAWHGKVDGRIQVFPAIVHTENCSRELLRAIREFAEERDLGYTIHLNQTHAEVQYMLRYHGTRPTEYLYQGDFLGPRLFAAHARYVDDFEISLLARTNTIVSHQAAMAANRGVSPPIPALRAAGVRICMGTDNNDNDMFAVMKVGLLTERIRRQDEHPGMLPQPEDILEDAALGGAYAIGMPESLGLVQPGRKADLIVLDLLKPHLAPTGRVISGWLHNGMASDVESVMVDGEFIMRDHRLTKVDEEALVRQAFEVGRRVWDEVQRTGPVEPPGRTGWR